MRNNKGITLLEVILTITILFIVLTTFLFLFPQISLFNKKTDETLSGINLAKEKISILENLVVDDRGKSDSDKTFSLSGNKLIINPLDHTSSKYTQLNLTEDIEEKVDAYILKTNASELQVTTTINRDPEYNGAYNLYKISVEIVDIKLNEVTNLYGYLSILK